MSKNEKILDNKEQSKISGGCKTDFRCPKCGASYLPFMNGTDSLEFHLKYKCKARFPDFGFSTEHITKEQKKKK